MYLHQTSPKFKMVKLSMAFISSLFVYLQKVFASRKELLEYDLQQREAATKSSRTTVQPTFTASQYRALSVLGCGHTSSTKCYGCASAVTEHCITLLRALATNSAIRHILVSQGLIRELFDYNLRRGAATMREEVRQLMCLLTRLVLALKIACGCFRPIVSNCIEVLTDSGHMMLLFWSTLVHSSSASLVHKVTRSVTYWSLGRVELVCTQYTADSGSKHPTPYTEVYLFQKKLLHSQK